MATGETFRATIISSTNDGNAIVNDFGYVDDNTGSTTHIDTGIAAGDFQTLIQAAMHDCMLQGVTIRRYRFACVGGTHKGEIGYVECDPPLEGEVSPDSALPSEIAISLQRKTGYASRHDRGRIFFGPVAAEFRDTANSDKVVVGDSRLEALRDKLKANLVTQTRTLHPCILNSAGSYNGHLITQVHIAEVFVHRKTRRFREAV